MVQTARRTAAKAVALIEKQGGLMLLACGCIIGMRAKEMRKLIEIAGPEEVVKILDNIRCTIHPVKIKKPRKSSRKLDK